MAAANRIAADNPLHEERDAEGLIPEGRFPRIEHPYPCGGCAAFHDDESGFCAQCSRRRLVPPHTVAMLARAQRKLYLCLLTLIMSIFETGDKAIIATFAASTTLVVLLSFLTKAVASQEPGPWIAGLVLVVAAAVCCGPAVRRMIRSIEAVDSISDEFDTAAKKLLADRDESQRGPASFKPVVPRSQPSWELRDLYVLARERRDLFAVEVLEVLARAGKQATEPSRVIRGPSVKGLARAREKTNLDYGGDASRIRDILRGSVVCETVDELNVVVNALRAVKDVEVIRIKNRFRDKPTPSGYRDVNINIDYHGMVVELQLHLSGVLQVADKQHVAYEAARELDLMGVLEKPDPSLSEAAPIEMKVAYNLARFVPALLSLLVAILYLDVFTFKGLRLIVRRADPTTWRGFEKPYIVHRVYGIALAAPYLANVYLLARAAGLFGEAAKDARRGRTRIGLLYEKYFGYEGSHFVWKVFCFQIVEVALQAAGKIPLFNTYLEDEEGGVAFWFAYIFILALLVNVLYPSLLLRSRLVFNQRDLAYSADTFLDIVYALTPFVFMLSGIRSQAMLIPHEPVAYVSNLIPLMHAHFVIATLETAGERERALKRVAPSHSAKDVADAPSPVVDAKDSDAPEATPSGATPAGRRYRGLVAFCLGCWTLAMGFFYMHGTPLQRLVGRRYTCVWSQDKSSRWTDWQTTNQTRNLTWTRSLMVWAKRSCAVDADCAAEPGCDGGYCDTLRGGFCVIGALDTRCSNETLGPDDFGDGGWCNHGKREVFCFSAFNGRFPLKCDVHADCAAVSSCNQPDLVGCFGGLCYAGAIDDRCYNSWDRGNSFYWEEITELDFAGEDPSVGDAGPINARCATAGEDFWDYIDYDDFSAGWCRDGRLDRPCFSPPDSKTSAADFVNSIHWLEKVERSDVEDEREESLCGYSFYLWNKVTRDQNWIPQLGFFLALFLVCAPFLVSLLTLPAHAERSLSVWRQTLCLVVICICFFLFLVCSGSQITGLGPQIIIFFLSVMGYVAAIAIEERVLVSAFVSVVVVLTVHYFVAVGVLVLGSSLVAFAPRSGERSKVKRGAQTKASLAADRGRLPRWACFVYFCVTTAFIALAFSGVLSTDESSSSCAPCDCRNNELIDCYGEVKTLEWTSTPWNRINSLSDDLDLFKSGIKGIVLGAFENVDQLKWLDLGRNELTELKASTFRGLHRLRELKLHGNEIREVWAGAFLGLDDLKYLDLSGNTRGRHGNDETDFRPGCFAGLGKLRELKLGFNYVLTFEDGVFEGLDSLETIDLKGMQYGLGCIHAYNAGLSTTVACSDKYDYELTAPFFVTDNLRDYATAVTTCERMGGEIATIKNADENERARWACEGVSCAGHSFKDCGEECLIGLEEVGGDKSTPTESQVWKWHDGSEVAYVNWDPGEPSNSDGPHDRRNAVMFCDDDGCNGLWEVFLTDVFECHRLFGCRWARALCRMK
mgnify:CR=1 FL=1